MMRKVRVVKYGQQPAMSKPGYSRGFNSGQFPVYYPGTEWVAPSTEVSKGLKPVPWDEANVEAEGGETAYVPDQGGMPAHFNINGPRHSEGGVPLNLPPDTFIYSDTRKMRLKGPILEYFGKDPKKTYTPAEIAKQYDINKYRKILQNPDSDHIQRHSAELMIQNYNKKLGALALTQEAKKGFPDGIPVAAMPFLMSYAIDPEMVMPQMPQEEQGEPMGEVESMEQGMPMGQAGMSVPSLQEVQDWNKYLGAFSDYRKQQGITDEQLDKQGYGEQFYNQYQKQNPQFGYKYKDYVPKMQKYFSSVESNPYASQAFGVKKFQETGKTPSKTDAWVGSKTAYQYIPARTSYQQGFFNDQSTGSKTDRYIPNPNATSAENAWLRVAGASTPGVTPAPAKKAGGTWAAPNYYQIGGTYSAQTEPEYGGNWMGKARSAKQMGGEEEQILQVIQMYAQVTGQDPDQLVSQLQKMPAEEAQQALQQMAQSLQQMQEQSSQTGAMSSAFAYGGAYVPKAQDGKDIDYATAAWNYATSKKGITNVDDLVNAFNTIQTTYYDKLPWYSLSGIAGTDANKVRDAQLEVAKYINGIAQHSQDSEQRRKAIDALHNLKTGAFSWGWNPFSNEFSIGVRAELSEQKLREEENKKAFETAKAAYSIHKPRYEAAYRSIVENPDRYTPEEINTITSGYQTIKNIEGILYPSSMRPKDVDKDPMLKVGELQKYLSTLPQIPIPAATKQSTPIVSAKATGPKYKMTEQGPVLDSATIPAPPIVYPNVPRISPQELDSLKRIPKQQYGGWWPTSPTEISDPNWGEGYYETQFSPEYTASKFDERPDDFLFIMKSDEEGNEKVDKVIKPYTISWNEYPGMGKPLIYEGKPYGQPLFTDIGFKLPVDPTSNLPYVNLGTVDITGEKIKPKPAPIVRPNPIGKPNDIVKIGDRFFKLDSMGVPWREVDSSQYAQLNAPQYIVDGTDTLQIVPEGTINTDSLVEAELRALGVDPNKKKYGGRIKKYQAGGGTHAEGDLWQDNGKWYIKRGGKAIQLSDAQANTILKARSTASSGSGTGSSSGTTASSGSGSRTSSSGSSGVLDPTITAQGDPENWKNAYNKLESDLKGSEEFKNYLYNEYIKHPRGKGTTLSPDELLNIFLEGEKQVYAIQSNMTEDERNSEDWDKYKDNRLYKKVAKRLGLPEFDTEKIKIFQRAYRQLQKGDVEQADPEVRKVLDKYDITPVGVADEPEGAGGYAKQVSGDDGIWGNTTLGHILTAKKEPAPPKKKEEPAPEKPLEYTPAQYVAQPGYAPWWMQDLVNIYGTTGDFLRLKKYLPWAPQTEPVVPDPVFYDPTRELAANAEQMAIGTQGASTFGAPQQFNARFSEIQGAGAKNAADILGRYNSLNVQTANAFEGQRAGIYNQANEYDARRAQDLYDKTTIANQQFDNSRAQARQNMRQAYITGITNRAQAQAMNTMYPDYFVDPSSGGFVHHRPGVNQMEDSDGSSTNSFKDYYEQLKKDFPNISDDELFKEASRQYREKSDKTKKRRKSRSSTVDNPYGYPGTNSGYGGYPGYPGYPGYSMAYPNVIPAGPMVYPYGDYETYG